MEAEKFELTKKLDEWNATPGKQTYFFTKAHPEKLLKDLDSLEIPVDKVETEEGREGANEDEDNSDEIDVTVDPDTYKVLIKSKAHRVSATIRIQGVKDNIFCVDYSLKEGDSLDSLNLFRKIKTYFAHVVVPISSV